MNMFSTGNPEEDELLRLLLQPRSVRARVREREMQGRQDAVPLLEDPIVRGTTRGGRPIGSKPSLFDVGYTVKQGRTRGGRNEGQIQPNSYLEGPFPGEKDEPEYRERRIEAGASDPIAEAFFAKQDNFRDLASGMDATQRRSRNRQSPELQQPARSAMQPVEGGDVAPVGEGVEVSLLERLGLAIRNNPELAAMGAQLAGGLISNAAQNRAQRQADRTNQQRTARSNLISALTGGRVRPDVERAQADTGGILSLNTLGQAIRGGGAVVQGELARQVEEDERKRRADLEERQVSVAEQQADTRESARIDEKSYRERIAELQEMGVAFDLYKLMNSGEKKETPPQQVRDQYAAASRIIRQVDNVERLLQDTGFFQSGSSLKLLQLAGLDEGLPQFMGGDKTRELKAAINTLVQTLGEGLSGVLSDRDIEFLRQQAIKETDSLDTAMLKAQQIRNRMASTITENYNIDSQYFNMAPFESIVEKVGAAGEQGFGAFVQDLANAKMNLD